MTSRFLGGTVSVVWAGRWGRGVGGDLFGDEFVDVNVVDGYKPLLAFIGAWEWIGFGADEFIL